MKGFKVTDVNMQCRSFQFSLGETFKITGKLVICGNGFHFCEEANACFNYYEFNPRNRVFEIEAKGEIVTDGDKSCAEEIEFVRELTWEEVLRLVNTGKANTGRANSGTGTQGTVTQGTGTQGTVTQGTGTQGTVTQGTGTQGTGTQGTGTQGTGTQGTGTQGTEIAAPSAPKKIQSCGYLISQPI